MQIRHLQNKDSKGLLALLDQSYDEVKANPDLGEALRLKRPSRRRALEWFRYLYNDSIRKGDCIYYVAVENGRIVGLCYAMKNDAPDSERSHVGTLGIRIAPGWRLKGLGTKLVKEVLKESRGKFDIVDVDIMSINKGSEALFKKLGFKRWGMAPGHVKRGKRYIDLEYMYLKL